jgi:hypothetical protein
MYLVIGEPQHSIQIVHSLNIHTRTLMLVRVWLSENIDEKKVDMWRGDRVAECHGPDRRARTAK